MSNGITRALVQIGQDLTRLTRRGAEGSADIDRDAARFVRGDVDEKLHTDRRGKHEIGQAGEGLRAPEPEKGDAHRGIQVEREGAFSGEASLGDHAETNHSSLALAGFGQEVDALAQRSPSLTRMITDLRREQWTFSYKANRNLGAGTIREIRQITLGGANKGNTARSVYLLSHEVGHATNELDPAVWPKHRVSEEEFAALNLPRYMKSEGQAEMTALQARDEILKSGGPDIRKSIGFVTEYDNYSRGIYEEYRNESLSWEEAADKISRKMFDLPVIHHDQQLNYRDQYEALALHIEWMRGQRT